MALIHVLDAVTASQIAAGEVVERPVNAVKELAENAVDAGATDIEVEIAGGGISYLRVTDNGCGMSPEDAKLSIVRHATSKIQSVDNIYHIASLGFRGEALASISSVSKMTITTRMADAEEGTVVRVEGGEVTKVEPAGAPEGTTVEASDLFYNVPARKKFLKSERAESSRINQMIGKMAMANPGIAFRLINNGRTVIETPGNGRLLDAVSALYGLETAGEMLDVSEEEPEMLLEGLISKPSLLKSSRQQQTLIVNRRIVENSAISKAVDNAYHSLLPKNGYPVLVLHLHVPPESVDVNVHPQKREVKFADEQAVFRLVYHAVLRTLTSQSAPEQIAASMIRSGEKPVLPEAEIHTVDTAENSGEERDGGSASSWSGGRPSSWQESRSSSYGGAGEAAKTGGPRSHEPAGQREYRMEESAREMFSKEPVFPRQKEETPRADPLFEDTPSKEEEPVIPLGQIADCFIVCQHGRDLFLIDQHAAHERVRYDRLSEAAGGIPVQDILVPYLIHADPSDVNLLLSKTEELRRLGIVLEQAGPDVVRVTAAPEDLSESDMERVIRDVLVAWHQKDVPSPETLRHRMLAYAACRGAIKAGDPLNIRQMRELIHDLFHTSRPFVCPHGRPTIVRFTPEELGRLFHRT